MTVSCTLCCFESRVKVLILADIDASRYDFIDKIFAQHHALLLHPLRYPTRSLEFDGQPALTDNITHVAEVIIDLGGYI